MNYAGLKAAFAAYSHRDEALTELAAFYLPLAEQRIYYGEQNTPALRISAMLKDGSSYALPADWLEMERVSSGKGKLDFRGYGEFADLAGQSGIPRFYSITGSTLAIAPAAAGQPVSYRYYARFITPSADADVNWLLTNAPGIYLSSLLIEVAQRTEDPALLAREVQNYTSRVTALMSQDRASQMSGAVLRQTSPVRR